MRYRYFTLFLLSILFVWNVCSKDPVRGNPYDPDSGLDPADWAPENLQIVQQNIHTAKLTWKRADERIDGFKIDRKIGSGEWLAEYATVAKNVYEYSDTNAVPADTNIYRVYAYAGENVSGSIETNTIIPFPAPTNLQIEQINLANLRLTWTDNSNGEDGFKVDRKIIDGDWIVAYARVGENINSWTDSDPEINVANSYRVYGYRGDVISNNISTICENSIPAPTEILVTQNGLSSVQITWHDSCEFETGYIIERSIAGGDWDRLIELIPNSERYDDTNIELGQTYQYRVAIQYESCLSSYGYSPSIRMGSSPEIPSSPSPVNGAIDQEIDVDLSWTCSDPDGDNLSYDVYFGNLSNPPLVISNHLSTSYNLGTLANSTTYYWKIVAQDEGGLETVGPIWNFTTRQASIETGTVTDIDGNIYQTVKIGDQWWMAENLKVTHYRNGDAIYNITDDTEWSNLTTGAYCEYNNNSSNVDTYGRLYNWYSVNDGRNIAPEGWHVPSDEEWHILFNYLGGLSIAGGKLKETGTDHWENPNLGANNESHFSSLPAGYRDTGGEYTALGYRTHYWSSTDYNTNNAFYEGLIYDSTKVGHYCNRKQLGFSVRCVMGENQAPNAPSNPNPSDAASDQEIDVDLSWVCSDPDGDLLTYEIYFGTSPSPPHLESDYNSNNYDPGTLGHSTTYFWKIVVMDDHGLKIVGPVWSFTTRASESNNAPNVPSDPNPGDSATDQPLSLELNWTCTDPDDDFLYYDVYFGNSSNPPFVASNRITTSFNLAGLVSNSVYYWKIVARDEGGLEAVGPVWSFTTGAPSYETGTVTDIDGNVYQTIKIGDQWWMAENLKVTHYRNGNAIPNCIDASEWISLAIGAHCNYANDESNVATYGRLYNWYVVSDSRDIAPSGWHVPSDEEWQTLIDYLGGESVAGGKMKEAGIAHWYSPNTGATNESGFAALPGGYRYGNGTFATMGSPASFWSSTEYPSSRAWYRLLYYNNSSVARSNDDKHYGFSVRLVRD